MPLGQRAAAIARAGLLPALDGAAAMAPMGALPLALIPGFVVPLLAITHLMVWLKLRQRA